MIINHNMPALNAHRQMYGLGVQQSKTMEKLSSGLRINRAADDAAGLAISEIMRNAIRGMNQASRNSQDAISLLQTAEGSLSQAQEIMGRIKELAVQASNDTYTANDRIELQKEVDALRGELQRVANSCNFNGKNLLDGSSAALASADKGATHIIVRGSIRNTDGTSAAGDYKITIDSTPGTAQILKSSIFKNCHAGDTVQNLYIDVNEGLNHLSATDIAHGSYIVSTSIGDAGSASTATITQFYVSTGSAAVSCNSIVATANFNTRNASVLLSCTYAFSDITEFNVTWMVASADGSYILSNGVVHQSSTVVTCTAGVTAFSLNASLSFSMDVSGCNYRAGDELVINVKASMDVALTTDVVAIRNDSYSVTSSINWAFNKNALNNQVDEFHFFSLNTDGTACDGYVSLSVSGLGTLVGSGTTFDFQEGLGEVSSLDTQLQDIDRFYDPNGRFYLENPQTITLVMGNGTQTSFCIFGTDSLKMIKDKFNSAISEQLGQGELVDPSYQDKFMNFVTRADTTDGSTETMEGGFVLRSAMVGTDGAFTVVAEEGLLNALGLGTAQEGTDSDFIVTVTDPLDESKIYTSNLHIAGNTLASVIHPNVDVKFDSLADMSTTWNNTLKTFDIYSNDTTSYTTFIHLVDNTQVFQVGGTEGQNMQAAIGDMRLEALGIDNIRITDVDSANKTISKMDNAFTRVSSQRASLGAIQNRCDYNIANLGAAGENLQASESRIRDADMAKEMMDLSRLNILNQSTLAMLAQANQQPQSVLQLLGR